MLSLQSSNAGGASMTYAYDALNRPTSVTDASCVTNYSYDAAGNLAGYAYPNGVSTTYNYNTLNRLINMQSICSTRTGCGAPQTPLAGYAYTLGPAGNRVSVAELSGRIVQYGYDDLYRLTSETVTGAAAQNGSISYAYDAVGNRTQRNSTLPALPATGLLNYDANDRTATDPYDANGNMLLGAVANVYDFENRVGRAGSIQIVYDGDGNRVQETVAGVTTSYLVADQNLTGYAQVVEELRNGALNRAYSYGLELINQRQAIPGASTPSFYGFDGHGSVRFLTSSTGAITDTYDYDAFGNMINSTGSTPNSYLFAGEQFDSALGVYYNRARYYDQRQGRFWSMDVSEGQNQQPLSLHKYLYAQSNPITNADPTGFESIVELSVTEDIGEVLDTQANPGRALQIESRAKVADIYFVFGLGNFGGGGKFAGIPLLPIPHAYIYANLKLANEGERFDVGVRNGSASNLLKSLITTVNGFVEASETDLGTVQRESLVMIKAASLSVLELGIWRAGLPAVATSVSTGINTIVTPAFLNSFNIPYTVFGEGELNCVTFSFAAALVAKGLENAPI